LWSHSHGALPTIERYGTYLEWHAMHCTIGKLLESHPTTKGEFYYDRLEYWLAKFLPTTPPEWISDHRGPTPLESRLWTDDPRTDAGWVLNAGREDFLEEIGILASGPPDWLVVEGHHTTRFAKREVNVRINTALVSSGTALPLVRALQTASNPYDFRIPDEGDDLEVDAPPYRLLGWIAHIETDTRFDDRDPCRHEVHQVSVRPGKELAEIFGLVPATKGVYTWTAKRTGQALLRYEAWSDESPSEDDRYVRRTRSDGWRLWVHAEMLSSYLLHKKMDLICRVQIDRKLRSEYGQSYDSQAKSKTHKKIVLFRATGNLEDSGRRISSWTGDRRSTQTGSGRRYTRTVDGAPHRRVAVRSRLSNKRKA